MFRTALAAVVTAFVAAGAAVAQPFPAKPVTILVGFPPGSAIDAFSRLIAPQLEAKWKQNVIVENRVGAGGLTALEYMVRQPADGTIIAPNAHTLPAYLVLQKNNPFDPMNDIAPVTMVGDATYVLVTSKEMPATNLKEFVAAVKGAPGKYNYGSVGRSAQTLDTIQFLYRAGLEMAQIPYNGSAPANLALLKNEIQLYYNSYFQAAAAAKEGTQKILAVAGPKRFPLLPDTPTLMESGYDVNAPLWYGFYASGKTPPAILDQLSRDVGEVVMQPAVKAKLQDLGIIARSTTPAETRKMLEESYANWREAARVAKIEPE